MTVVGTHNQLIDKEEEEKMKKFPITPKLLLNSSAF